MQWTRRAEWVGGGRGTFGVEGPSKVSSLPWGHGGKTPEVSSPQSTCPPFTPEETPAERPAPPQNTQQVSGRAGTESWPRDCLDDGVFTPSHRLRDERDATERFGDLLTYFSPRGHTGWSFVHSTNICPLPGSPEADMGLAIMPAAGAGRQTRPYWAGRYG